MRRLTILTLICAAIAVPLSANAQVAGSTLVGVAAAELRDVAAGWSAKRQVLGRPVYNDQGKPEPIGKIDDIIISPDKAVSNVIINAGGFLGAFKHDVAVPVAQLKEVGDKLVLPGAASEALKASPAFEYAH